MFLSRAWFVCFFSFLFLVLGLVRGEDRNRSSTSVEMEVAGVLDRELAAPLPDFCYKCHAAMQRNVETSFQACVNTNKNGAPALSNA